MTYMEIAIAVKWAQFAASVAMIVVSVVFCVASWRLMKSLKPAKPKPVPEAWTPLIKGGNNKWINEPLRVGVYDIRYTETGYVMCAFWDGTKFLSPERRALIGQQPDYWRPMFGPGER